MPTVTVVGLGPGAPDLVTAGALAAIERIPVRFLRTARHPSAGVVADARSFDHVYDSEATFDEVYAAIVDELIEAAIEHGEVLYAVPGSPRVLERTVDLLANDDRVEVEVVPGMSFVELAWVRLGVDPIERGARLLDGHQFAVAGAGERGPLLVAHCHNQRVLSEIKLALDLDGPPVTVLQRLGLPDEAIFTLERAELDRSFTPDHLTSLWIPDAAAPVASEVARFDQLVHVLRERCPWDRAQTHASLTRHLLEETYEVLDALSHVDPDTGAGYDHLEEELGDLLFQICFHTTLAAENGAFTLDDVAAGIHDKLVSRHPHVFASGPSGPQSGERGDARDWEELKRDEKSRDSVFDGIPVAMPALLYAFKVVGKAQSVGETIEPAQLGDDDIGAGEIGSALLTVVAAARVLDVDPEAALRAAADELRYRAAATERAREG